jgi:tetratricopeptide (TPR) repeat protein
MQWLAGEDLAERLSRGALAESDARDLVARLGDALGDAHALGVVHRDVKPSNVILIDGDVARATLIDFGVALASDRTPSTRTGLIVGTPGYMAPEQARASRDVDARADVYALGCVLFECLTGRAPFRGEHPVAVLAKVLLDEPPRLRSLAPSASADMERLVARMLAKDPARRPADGHAVARLLRATPSSVAPSSVKPSESVSPESITDDERVVVHVILAMRGDDHAETSRTQAHDERAFDPDEFERRFGAHADVMADGSVLATLKPGALGAKAGATRAAIAASELAREIGGAVALASGLERLRRGVPLGQVVDRAVDISRRAHGTDACVVVDELTSALLRGASVIASRDGLRVLVSVGAQPFPSHPIVGRERELVALSSLADEIAAASASRVALVTSPPGGGKTRLAAELLARLRERDDELGLCVVRAEEPLASAPLAVATEIACAIAGVARGDLPDERNARLAAHLERTTLARDAKTRVMDFVGDMIGATLSPSLALLAARTDAITMSDQIQRAFVELVAASCASPFVIVLDDLQWCDRASFRLVDAIVRELESMPLLVIGLARPDFDASFPNAFADRALTRLPLAALGKRSAETLVRAILFAQGGVDASDAVVAEVVARGDGNAFMLEELARGIRDGRALDQLGGTTAVVASRFEALSPEARRVLRAASIIGQRAPSAAIAALVGTDPDDASLTASLVELEQAEIVVTRDGESAFRHALLRDAAYATLTEEDKALGHKLAARFFETALGVDPMVVATHAELGGDLALAARAYVDAARSALESTDLAGVGDRVNAAIRCGAQGELLARAERFWAESSFWLGALREAEDHAARAIELFGETRSADFFSAAGYLIGACSRLGKPDAALAHTQRVLAARAPADARAARTMALLTAAAFLPLQGQIDLARAILRDIEPTTRELASQSPTLVARFARATSICAMASGDLDAYTASARAAADRFTELGDRRNALQQRGNVVYALLEVGDDAGAVAEGRSALAEAEKMHLRNVIAMISQNVGHALVRSGAREEGQAMLEAALREFESQGHARMAGGTRIYLASARIAAGDPAGALAEIDRALVLLASTPPLRAYALAVRANVLATSASPEEARVASDEALAILDSLGGIDSGETDVYLAATRARRAMGDETGARAVLKRGVDRLMSRAARLSEPNRTTFLRNVPSNVALLDLVEAKIV